MASPLEGALFGSPVRSRRGGPRDETGGGTRRSVVAISDDRKRSALFRQVKRPQRDMRLGRSSEMRRSADLCHNAAPQAPFQTCAVAQIPMHEGNQP